MADLELVVTPRASDDRIGPWADGRLRVRVTRPPSDGQANRAVLRLLARALRIPPGAIELVSGERHRRKRVRIADMDPAELARRLATVVPD